MDTFDAIEQRRSVKHYDPEHRLSEDEIEKLLSTAILAPTSFNIQNWRYVVVTDPAVRAELRAAAWDQAQVTDASVVIVVCGDLKSWNREPARYWRNTTDEVRAMLLPMIANFYEGKEQLQRDEAMRSAGLTDQTIMLAAKAMGYDSCPMIGFDAEKVAEIIRLPADHAIGMMITVGKALKPANPRGGQLPLAEVVYRNGF